MMSVRSFALAVACLSAGANASSHFHIGEHEEALTATMPLFQAWRETHSKDYSSEEEWSERLRNWHHNNERIEAHNNQTPTPTYTLGHNEYSDLTPDEFAQRFRLGKYSPGVIQREGKNVARHLEEDRLPLQLPDAVNWIALGGVTPVKNQGACGSCWAFSTTGAVEGAKFVKTGELVSLSEQNLVDCDHQDLGCSGGLMDDAFKFDEKNGGLCSEADYPYLAKQGECNPMQCEDVPGSEVTNFYDVPAGNVKSLLSAIAMQPISVAIQADQFAFQFYKGGVLTGDGCGSQLDHGVLAVGYGSDLETNEPYFMVKNSWGESWGENGYIRLSRNAPGDYGMCGILKMASYPEVA